MTEERNYDAESRELLEHFDKYILRNFGARCLDFDKDCAICDIWKKRDELRELICD